MTRVDKEQKKLVIIYGKLYCTASIDTLRRWIKETFAETNLIVNSLHIVVGMLRQLKHSLRILILDILRKACWSSAKTFLQHYKKETVSYEGVDFNKIIEL